MSDMMASGAAWFEAQRRKYLVAPVQYRVGGTGHPINCGATIAVGRWEAVNAAGQIVRMETRDFVIANSELHITPQRGDTVTLIEGDVEVIYRVVIPDGAEQAWRWADRSQASRRIHTQELSRYG